ncbi:MAG: hypothetical protein HYX40_07440 [Sphingobacteriales bacterium]|nr:hypothetical protein [Sphingobacteriales bacterium]
MTKNDIIQFVCFETNIEIDEFAPMMENYIRRSKEPHHVIVHETQKGRIKYVSRHIALKGDFRFIFSKGKTTDTTSKTNLRVIQAGGYMPLQQHHHPESDTELATVLVFMNEGMNDIAAFHSMENYKHLNIYEAYYESCRYPYILEFFTEEYRAEELLKELKLRPVFSHAAIYKECLVQEA